MYVAAVHLLLLMHVTRKRPHRSSIHCELSLFDTWPEAYISGCYSDRPGGVCQHSGAASCISLASLTMVGSVYVAGGLQMGIP